MDTADPVYKVFQEEDNPHKGDGFSHFLLDLVLGKAPRQVGIGHRCAGAGMAPWELFSHV